MIHGLLSPVFRLKRKRKSNEVTDVRICDITIITDRYDSCFTCMCNKAFVRRTPLSPISQVAMTTRDACYNEYLMKDVCTVILFFQVSVIVAMK